VSLQLPQLRSSARCLCQHPISRVVEAESVGDAIKESKQGGDIDRLRDLRIGPARRAGATHLVVGHARRRQSQCAHQLQQRALARLNRGGIQLAAAKRVGHRFRPALQLQEVAVRAQSVLARIQAGDVGGDHFLDAAPQVTVAEVNAVAELDYLSQEIGASAEAFEDVRHARPAGIGGFPGSIDLRDRARGFLVLDPANSWHGMAPSF